MNRMLINASQLMQPKSHMNDIQEGKCVRMKHNKQFDEEKFSLNKFQIGDLVWAKPSRGIHPWWPCMVSSASGVKPPTSSSSKRYVYVEFFGPISENAWISEASLITYNGVEAFKIYAQDQVDQAIAKSTKEKLADKYQLKISLSKRDQWEKAVQEADMATCISTAERCQLFVNKKKKLSMFQKHSNTNEQQDLFTSSPSSSSSSFSSSSSCLSSNEKHRKRLKNRPSNINNNKINNKSYEQENEVTLNATIESMILKNECLFNTENTKYDSSGTSGGGDATYNLDLNKSERNNEDDDDEGEEDENNSLTLSKILLDVAKNKNKAINYFAQQLDYKQKRQHFIQNDSEEISVDREKKHKIHDQDQEEVEENEEEEEEEEEEDEEIEEIEDDDDSFNSDDFDEDEEEDTSDENYSDVEKINRKKQSIKPRSIKKHHNSTVSTTATSSSSPAVALLSSTSTSALISKQSFSNPNVSHKRNDVINAFGLRQRITKIQEEEQTLDKEVDFNLDLNSNQFQQTVYSKPFNVSPVPPQSPPSSISNTADSYQTDLAAATAVVKKPKRAYNKSSSSGTTPIKKYKTKKSSLNLNSSIESLIVKVNEDKSMTGVSNNSNAVACSSLTSGNTTAETYLIDRYKYAVRHIRQGLSVEEACNKYRISKGALLKCLSGGTAPRGKKTRLTEIEENEIVEWLINNKDLKYNEAIHLVFEQVEQIFQLAKRPNPFHNGKPSMDWWYDFLSRHPQIMASKPEWLRRGKVNDQYIRDVQSGKLRCTKFRRALLSAIQYIRSLTDTPAPIMTADSVASAASSSSADCIEQPQLFATTTNIKSVQLTKIAKTANKKANKKSLLKSIVCSPNSSVHKASNTTAASTTNTNTTKSKRIEEKKKKKTQNFDKENLNELNSSSTVVQQANNNSSSSSNNYLDRLVASLISDYADVSNDDDDEDDDNDDDVQEQDSHGSSPCKPQTKPALLVNNLINSSAVTSRVSTVTVNESNNYDDDDDDQEPEEMIMKHHFMSSNTTSTLSTSQYNSHYNNSSHYNNLNITNHESHSLSSNFNQTYNSIKLPHSNAGNSNHLLITDDQDDEEEYHNHHNHNHFLFTSAREPQQQHTFTKINYQPQDFVHDQLQEDQEEDEDDEDDDDDDDDEDGQTHITTLNEFA